LLANETTSLCLPEADQDFRFALQSLSAETTPALIFLSTDGYLNSFANEAGFFQAGTDIAQMLATDEGHSAVGDNLKAWLEEATRMGSGDDCTVAVIYSPEALKTAEKAQSSETIETIITEMPLSPETSQAIVALTDSETVIPENTEDVTVTITIKKDKNKKHAVTLSKDQTVSSVKNEDDGTKAS